MKFILLKWVLIGLRKNLKLDTDDVVEYCRNKVLDKNCNIYKKGKNYVK